MNAKILKSQRKKGKSIATISLRRWLPVYAVLLPVLVFLSWAALDYFHQYSHQIRYIKAQRVNNFSLADILMTQLQNKPDPTSVREILRQFSKDPAIRELVVYTPDNSVYSSVSGTAASPAKAVDKFNFDPSLAARARQSKHAEFVLQGDWLGAYYSFQAQTQNYQLPPGYLLFLKYDISLVRGEVVRTVMRDALWPFGLLLLGTLFALWFIRRFVNLPLNEMLTAMQGFERQERIQSSVRGSGELSAIAQMFNRGSARMMDMLEELSEREQFVERLFKSVAEGVIVTDAAARVIRITPTAERLLGCRQEEVIGLSVGEIFKPVNINNRKSEDNAAIRALQTGCVVEPEEEQMLVSSQGLEYYITQVASPLFNIEGKVEGVFLTFRDITDVHLARVERGISAAAFESDEPVIVADHQGRILRVNSATRNTGFYQSVLEGTSLSELYQGANNNDFKQFIESPGDLNSCSARTERLSNTGNVCYLIETITAVRDASGALNYFVLTQRDISELVQTAEALSESEGRSRLLIQSMVDGVGLFDSQGFCTEANESLINLLGCERGELIGKKVSHFSERFQPDGRESEQRWAELFTRSNDNADLEWRAVHSLGKKVDLKLSVVKIERGELSEFLVTFHDITRRKERERRIQNLVDELIQAEQTARLAAIAGKVGIFDFDLEKNEIGWVEGTERSFGLPEKMAGQTLERYRGRMQQGDYERILRLIEAGAESGEPIEWEQYYAPEDGENIWIRVTGEVRLNSQGGQVFRGAVVNITAAKEAHLEAEKLAYYDVLTGLANRRLLLDRLKQSCVQAERQQSGGAVLFLDLDHFKAINDSLGHKTGDAVLKEAATRLTGLLREGDTVARLGGDEFVIILSDLAPLQSKMVEEVENIAQKVIAALGESFEVEGQSCRLGVSIGAALFPKDGHGSEVLERADLAMYKAKNQEGNTLAFYEPDLPEKGAGRLFLEKDLHSAIEQQEMRYYLQVQVDSQGRIVGAEMLLRWFHSQLGLLLPGDFIADGNEKGFMEELDAWVLHQACRQLKEWNNRGLDLTLSVNVRAEQFKTGVLVEALSAGFAEFDFSPERLILEVPEEVVVDTSSGMAERVIGLAETGAKIAMSHFDVGGAPMPDLQDRSIDYLKIDGRYAKNITTDKESRALVEELITAARDSGIAVVAERIETQQQFEFFRARGCSVYQGYLFGKPVNVSEFDRMLSLEVKTARNARN